MSEAPNAVGIDRGLFTLDDSPRAIDWNAADHRRGKNVPLFRLETDFKTITFGPEFKAALEKVIRETILAVHLESMVPQKETER